jgi:gliding motility-associated-like protein
MANGATTYQWFITTQSVTTAIANNSIFSGANSNTLNISNIPIQLDGSQLYCSIGGACNITINSDTLTINLNINPTITQPTNQTGCIGSNTNFTVSTTATNATYQWYLSTDNGINYNVVLNSGQYSGANSNSLSISNLTQLNDSTFFYCIITDACNASITTNSAILIIDDGVVGFGFQPTPKTVCEGQTVSFSCTSNNALTFQWQVGVNGVFSNLINNFNFSGCSTNILTINNASLNFNGNTYRCIISSCGSSINSIDASLTVKPKVVIVTQPNQIKLCLNEIAQLSLTAIGNGLTYQWQIKNTGGSFSNIALNNTLFYGINGPIIEVTANLTLQGKVIRCLVTDSCGAAISSEVSILITEPPRVNIQPKSESTCEGKNVYFTFDIYGDSLNYEWYFRTDSNSNFKKVTQSTLQYDSANSRILQVKNVMLENDGYQFYCTVASCNQPLRSDTVTLKVKNKVIPVFIPTCFTPNGDGLNEVLEFVGIKDTEIEGSIYNRWGQKIFDFSKYEPIWDGRYLNAKVQSGTYPYVITNIGKGCSGIITQGYIDVIR